MHRTSLSPLEASITKNMEQSPSPCAAHHAPMTFTAESQSIMSKILKKTLPTSCSTRSSTEALQKHEAQTQPNGELLRKAAQPSRSGAKRSRSKSQSPSGLQPHSLTSPKNTNQIRLPLAAGANTAAAGGSGMINCNDIDDLERGGKKRRTTGGSAAQCHALFGGEQRSAIAQGSKFANMNMEQSHHSSASHLQSAVALTDTAVIDSTVAAEAQTPQIQATTDTANLKAIGTTSIAALPIAGSSQSSTRTLSQAVQPPHGHTPGKRSSAAGTTQKRDIDLQVEFDSRESAKSHYEQVLPGSISPYALEAAKAQSKACAEHEASGGRGSRRRSRVPHRPESGLQELSDQTNRPAESTRLVVSLHGVRAAVAENTASGSKDARHAAKATDASLRTRPSRRAAVQASTKIAMCSAEQFVAMDCLLDSDSSCANGTDDHTDATSKSVQSSAPRTRRKSRRAKAAFNPGHEGASRLQGGHESPPSAQLPLGIAGGSDPEFSARYWRQHVFVKLLFVSSRAINKQIVSGRSQVGWAVIVPAAETLRSLSYRQRSELVRSNGGKVAIRYLLAHHEKESLKGQVRRGRCVGGKQFMAMSAAWYDVIDVEAIFEAGSGLFSFDAAQTAAAGYPMFKCDTQYEEY